jgi:phosphohistidine swiveling domain-containing protein
MVRALSANTPREVRTAGRLGSELIHLQRAGIQIVPTILIESTASVAFQGDGLPSSFFGDLWQAVQDVLRGATSAFVRASPPLNSIWCEDKISSSMTAMGLKHAVERVFRSLSSPRSRASRLVSGLVDQSAAPAVLIQPYIPNLSSILSRHAVSGQPTTEENWQNNINNRLAEHHSACIAASREAERCLGQPVILWLSTSPALEVASVSDAIMLDRARFVALCDLHRRGTITDIDLLCRIQPNMLGWLQGYAPEPADRVARVRGLPASPGGALGRVVFPGFPRNPASDLPAVFFVKEIVPDHVHDVEDAVAVVTSRGGMTSHAAVMCRGMSMPCVAGCEELVIDERKRVVCTSSGVSIHEDAPVFVDGSTGQVDFCRTGALAPEYILSDHAVDFLAYLTDLLRDVTSTTRFAKLSLTDQTHIARLKFRLKELRISS